MTRELQDFVAYFWGGSVKIRATSMSAARRQVKERWFAHERIPPGGVEIYRDSPSYQQMREHAAAMDMAYDLAVNDGGAAIRAVESKYNQTTLGD
jgi:hypothetical protein